MKSKSSDNSAQISTELTTPTNSKSIVTPGNENKSDLQDAYFTSYNDNNKSSCSAHNGSLDLDDDSPDSQSSISILDNIRPRNASHHLNNVKNAAPSTSARKSGSRRLDFSPSNESNTRAGSSGSSGTLSYDVLLLNEKIKHLESLNEALVNKISDLISGNNATSTLNGNSSSNVPLVKKIENLSINASLSNKNVFFNRIFIFTDSMGRNISHFLKERVPKSTEVFSLVKPGAKFSDIVSPIPSFCSDFTKNDVIIVMGGSNDFESCAPNSAINLKISNLNTLSSCTNIILHNVPYRFDQKAHLSSNIYETNQSFKFKSKHNENFHYLGTNSTLMRYHFTRHGFHLNKKGKKVVVNEIMKLLFDLSKLVCKTLPSISAKLTHSKSQPDLLIPRNTTPPPCPAKSLRKLKTPSQAKSPQKLKTPLAKSPMKLGKLKTPL